MSDNSWYENGERPPVGSSVIYKGDGYDGRNKDFEGKAIVCLSHFNANDCECIAFSCGQYGIGAAIYYKSWYEPIKTERELAIDAAIKATKETVFVEESVAKVAGILFDAGLLRSKNES